MMTLKLVCECGTINESDAKYCKECGKGKGEVSTKITKLAELARVKTWTCMKCGNETAEVGLCSKCRQLFTQPFNNPNNLEIRY